MVDKTAPPDPAHDDDRDDPFLRDLARTPEVRAMPAIGPLTPGGRVGPYEIVASLGAGGMGEVYRARDPRLGREVAIKVLSTATPLSTAQLRRFELEARAAGALNHPNVLGVHDVGDHDGAPYLVLELLEGETLRQRLRAGALPPRKTLDYALQIARGLGAAHERGIVHRDLKPENLFLTRDGRLKILDFGLAKLTHPSDGSQSRSYHGTSPGTVMGTVGYMAPEQVRAEPADHRADLFAFGAILYEMLTGTRAFAADSAVETLNAILKEEPPPLSATTKALPPALERIVRHCLEKNPEERFQSARDLAFDLESVASDSAPSQPAHAARHTRPRRALWFSLGGGILAAAGLAAAFWLGQRTSVAISTPAIAAESARPPRFRRMSFRSGWVGAAKFAPDGNTIVYSGGFEGRPIELYSTRPESPESRPLGLRWTNVASIAANGDMAVLVYKQAPSRSADTPTLARVPLAGGAPREVLERVSHADWIPGEDALAVIHQGPMSRRIEFPIGNVVYETAGSLSNLRVSPDGKLAAFLDHPVLGDDRGRVMVIDRAGHHRVLSDGWASAAGLCFTPSGREVWFTATEMGAARALQAVTLEGQQRTVLRIPGTLMLHDIGRDGRVLLSTMSLRQGIRGLRAGEKKERELGWLDYSRVIDLSDDGEHVLFDESGAGGGLGYSVYLRKTDGSPAVRLGEGYGASLSPDGKWAVAIPLTTPRQLMLLPTGAGAPRRLTDDAIDHERARLLPDGKRYVFRGQEPGRKLRCYVADLDGKTPPRPVTPEGLECGLVLSANGDALGGRDAQKKAWLYPLDGSPPRPVSHLREDEEVVRIASDGRALFLAKDDRQKQLGYVLRLDVQTGKREVLHELRSPDTGEGSAIHGLRLSGDGKGYAYTYPSILSDLYLGEDLK